MPKTAPKPLPVADFAPLPVARTLAEVTAVGPEVPGLLQGASPVAQLQRELYQRFNAERHPPVTLPFAPAVRLALLAGAGVAAWFLFYAIARAAFSWIH